MAGRIRDEDVAAVREKSSIAEVIGEHVQLRNAGGGNLKGICPFHDEKSPSLSVTPARNLFHCFGCGAGGDVIRFVERIEHLSFAEAVENLASRLGIQLRYAEGGSSPNRPAGQRARLVEAHTLAAAYYVEQLRTPDAQPARQYLTERGFDEAVTVRFGCGYAPAGWDSLTKYLMGRGFSPAELTLAGLARESGRGSMIDRFHRRLLWPIKDVSGDVVGFGARRIHDDDKIEAKYLNTPETPLYKKSQLLYGMDVAKREIAKQHQAVIVEGYTDVMACHLAGVTTAVATCGTSFGSEHIGVIRRLLMDNDAFAGQVVFTFDGDAAGMKAAERAFAEEQKFMSQTYVAIEGSGKDPCELRQSGGDPAVRALIEARVPLVEFVLKTTVARHDLNSAEGRVAALDRGVPLVAMIKDHALRDEYARRLAGLVGVDEPNRIVARVRGLVRSGERTERQNHPVPQGQSSSPGGVPPRVMQDEREVIKAALQLPDLVGKQFDELGPLAFLVAVHQQLQTAIGAAGGAAAAQTGPSWPAQVAEHLPPDSEARSAVNALAVEPLRSGTDAQPRYAEAMVSNLAEQVVAREVAQLKSRVQRLDADSDEVGTLFAQLAQLEQRRRELRLRAIGGES
ncbi:MAG: DNA primase [Actinomycetota bacterium]|nr:DNA primase [Actinomycetota bacterium]MDQ2955749.1 DNA primase [Actinomycetota bacterium]